MIKIALRNLLKHKKRTIISMIGITLGIASIIALVSIVDGLYFDIQNALSEIQGITVIQKGAAGPLFSRIDSSFESKLEKINFVKTVIPTGINVPRTIDGKKIELTSFSSGFIRIVGSDYSKKTFNTAAGIGGKIIEGKNLTANDRKKVVIGKELKKQLNKFVGNSIEINGQKFKIIGVYETASKTYNSSILMSIEDFREINNIPKDKVPEFVIELSDTSKTDSVVKEINLRFDSLKAYSSKSFSQTIGSFLDSLKLLVIAIAAVSAIVAGIGIMNTMLMSIIERFQEIGTLKAVGWTNSNIMQLILFESMIIGILGSSSGLILGIAIGKLLIEKMFNLTVVFQPYLLIGSFLFGIIVSLIAGLYPAKVAADLNPIEALREE